MRYAGLASVSARSVPIRLIRGVVRKRGRPRKGSFSCPQALLEEISDARSPRGHRMTTERHAWRIRLSQIGTTQFVVSSQSLIVPLWSHNCDVGKLFYLVVSKCDNLQYGSFRSIAGRGNLGCGRVPMGSGAGRQRNGCRPARVSVRAREWLGRNGDEAAGVDHAVVQAALLVIGASSRVVVVWTEGAEP